MRFHCATVLVVLSICAPLREHCWWCNANGHSHNALFFLHYRENAPCYGNNYKNVSLAAIARYVSITTIYTIGYLQIFNEGHFFSSKHCHDLQRKFSRQGIFFQVSIAMICKETSIGLPWFSTNPQIMTLCTWQARLHPADIFNGTNNWTCFWIFRAKCPLALPLIVGSAAGLVSIT